MPNKRNSDYRQFIPPGLIGTTIGEMNLRLLKTRSGTKICVDFKNKTYQDNEWITHGKSGKPGKYRIKAGIANDGANVLVVVEINPDRITKLFRGQSGLNFSHGTETFKIIPPASYASHDLLISSDKDVQDVYNAISEFYLYKNNHDSAVSELLDRIAEFVADEHLFSEELQKHIPEDGILTDEVCLHLLKQLKSYMVNQRLQPSMVKKIVEYFKPPSP